MNVKSLAGDACEHFSTIMTYAKYSHGFVMLFVADVEKWDCIIGNFGVALGAVLACLVYIPVLYPLGTLTTNEVSCSVGCPETIYSGPILMLIELLCLYGILTLKKKIFDPSR